MNVLLSNAAIRGSDRLEPRPLVLAATVPITCWATWLRAEENVDSISGIVLAVSSAEYRLHSARDGRVPLTTELFSGTDK